ncbi:MAG: UDP-N-acetylglucosamine 1-carboxyvinyltransferase [Candidatus Pacebacteria bacterium CG10_big_fil_rev_8_21_14_0_10_36_11]|nr:UDP-N-acetylglucosamine 1-carboxyvinyltransferase [Candidatus Pacearchaeota archaeon]OIP74563.1 MAG: UDP-N-acetylglucosamine 1-carboxyvinyltransferase [Candidatus Pacebacteria bacterium CG2_30_36_39]PIR65189.1 MAG: UDP-N-acetylglucosamine 1-carboxyvinyltransferase [Candidatus Pacebacteria bacterium CG10_big_fil_rev_8_21_14_0_10_36_11]PJC42370.1 MAG: UDP-N-acetylglucosamine 1-carboxyvinyltransferase [Candidatus Pacebacteria bacterium CG_4_9_14_0_2_um_filter_36_8]
MTTGKTSFVITGGTPLRGSVRVSGAKNASYKLMVAALLGDEKSRILNLPAISDVAMVAEVINSLGAEAKFSGEGSYFIDPKGLNSFAVGNQYGAISRASTIFIAPLLAKFGEAQVPLPGGDKIGKRPLERHFEGLEKMGASFSQENGMLIVTAEKLIGTRYRFAKNTHTGTETLILAAVKAEGTTYLENAALEPEIDDLILFLNNMGAKIRRTAHRTIEIQGVEHLTGAIHRVMPDRNEAVSYACAAIASKGDIIVENAREADLIAFLQKLDEIGGGYEIGDYGIRFFYKGPLKATDLLTEIHPGFMTDWQPLWAVLACHAKGTSIIHETVMQNRFQYVDILRQMGANIEEYSPLVNTDAEEFYNFNWQDRKETDIRAIKITGPTNFNGGEFTVHDLRAGATVMLAAISGTGQTILHNVEQIERGYSEIDKKLVSMGAEIKRVIE